VLHLASRDGTPIAYERSGKGPPLVLVHGTGTDHTYWALLAPRFAQHFTVYAVDRRGRGASGDAVPYAIQREFGDVAALVDSIPGEVGLLGHSYGALLSLEAALLTTHIHKLALYEPPMYATVDVSYPPGILERFCAYVDAGKAEDALVMLYEVGETPAEELRLMRDHPDWPARVRAAATIPREVLSVRRYSFDPGRFKDLATPTLLLVGGESMPIYKAAIDAVHASLPQSRVTVLPEQGHEAVITAPDLFLRQALAYFRESG
jgi:pimeloyl-ACP methyl ester carboxylesterase